MVWSIFPPPGFAGTSEPAGRCCQASSIRFCGDVRKDLGPRSANDCHFQLGKCGSWRSNQSILWACLNPRSQVWTLALAMAHCDCEWHLAMAMACYGYGGKILNWKIKGLAKIGIVLLLLVSNHPKKSYDYVFEYLSNLSMYFFEKNTAGVTFCGPGGSESHTLCSHRSVSCCCLVGPKLLPNQLLLDLIGRKPGKSPPKNWENGGFSSHVWWWLNVIDININIIILTYVDIYVHILMLTYINIYNIY